MATNYGPHEHVTLLYEAMSSDDDGIRHQRVDFLSPGRLNSRPGRGSPDRVPAGQPVERGIQGMLLRI